MATLKEIAKIAGVNVSTVSKALNGHNDINEETKGRIIKITQQMNYFNKKSNVQNQANGNYMIGVICPEIDSNFYAQIVTKIEEKVMDKGYSLVIGLSQFNPEKESNYLRLLLNKGVDGVVLITSTNQSIADIMSEIKKDFNIPIIVITVNQMVDCYDSIKIDDHIGVTMAINHLIQLGHKKIGYVGDRLSMHRLDSFREALDKSNARIEEKWIRIGTERFEEGGYLRMKEILKSKELPTAILASYDDIAIGAMRAIHEKGMRIPQDISIVGVDNIGTARYLNPNLTTVSEPVNEMGDIACSILFNKIENKAYTTIQSVVLKPELIIRESTACIEGSVNLEVYA